MFEFASYLLLVAAFPNSLLYPSLYGLITTLAAVIGSSYVGKLVDKYPRLAVVRTSLMLQKLSIIASSVCFYVLLRNGSQSPIQNNLLFSGIVALGCLLKLSSTANDIAIEKDWTMVISGGNTTPMLTVMRRIDLFCKAVAPVAVGFLALAGSQSSAIIMGSWALISAIAEYYLIHKVYNSTPELALPRTSNQADGPLPETENVSFRDYTRHKIFLASLSLALLYLTVLSFGGVMISYLKLVNYPEYLLGIMRAVAAGMGILATYLMPILSRRIGIVRTGLWSLWSEVLALIPVVLAIALAGTLSKGTTSALLFGGMALSRVGLWMFDLSETVLLQRTVNPTQIGSISGWQYSLCNFFDLVQYTLTVIVSNPQLFIIPAAISFAAVAIAAIIYSFFVFKEHGHLFHKEKLKDIPSKSSKKISTFFLDLTNRNKKEIAQIEEVPDIPLETIASTSSEPVAEEITQNLGETFRQIPAEEEIIEEEITASVQQDDYSR